jgi:hypothetical protein
MGSIKRGNFLEFPAAAGTPNPAGTPRRPGQQKSTMPKTKTNDDARRAVTIWLSKIDCELLACLDENHRTRHDQENGLNYSLADILQRLADHAVSGVYRPGCWERQWISQVFSDFEENLEPGDPYGRTGEIGVLFQRPKKRAGAVAGHWLKKVVPGLQDHR